MKFSSFLIILLGVNLTGISVGIVVGYYIKQYYWVYLSVPILTIGSLLIMYGTLNKENNK